MNLIFLGAPGSGKGTQAQQISKKYSKVHISTGDIFRNEIKSGTELGEKIKGVLSRGELVSDELVLEVIKNYFSKNNIENGFILDGFPRTIKQSEMFDNFLLEKNNKIDYVILLDVKDEVIIARLSSRLYCKGCGKVYNKISNPPKVEGVCDDCSGVLETRVDDQEETIRNRLKVYHESTAPLIEYYKNQGKLIVIDGSGSPEKVNAELEKIING